MKKILHVAAAILIFTSFGSAALADDGTITTRAQADVKILPLLSSIQGVVQTTIAVRASDRAAMDDVRLQTASLMVTLGQIRSNLAATGDATSAEAAISDVSLKVGALSQEVGVINAREAMQTSLLSAISAGLSGILSAYLALPA